MPRKRRNHCAEQESSDIFLYSYDGGFDSASTSHANGSFDDSGSDITDLKSENESDVSIGSDESVFEDDGQESVSPPKRSKNETGRHFDWTKIGHGEFVPETHQFNDENAGCKADLGDSPSALECFEVFFSNDLVDGIVRETNKYYDYVSSDEQASLFSRLKKWNPVDRSEMYVFIALSLLMPLTKKQKLDDYWSTNAFLRTPVFGQIMSRDRYLGILKMLHFSDNNKPDQDDPLFLVRSIVDVLRTCFKQTLAPFQNLAVGESSTIVKTRLPLKQYMPSKCRYYGLKLFLLCDCETGYVLDFVLYTGTIAQMTRNIGTSGIIVLTLLEGYLKKGHSVYVDNWYTSPSLFSFLHEEKTNACGAADTKRKDMPPLDEKLQPGDQVCYRSEKLLTTKFTDSREVTILSTIHTNEMVAYGKGSRQKLKPLCLLKYNEHMAAVDNVDVQLSSIEPVRKTLKWYKKVFFRLLDLSVLNAHVIYRMKTGKNISLPQFQLELIKEITDIYQTARPRVGRSRCASQDAPMRLTARHFPSRLEMAESGQKIIKKRCVVCMKHKIRRETTFQCAECNAPLCITDCFKKYHTVKTY